MITGGNATVFISNMDEAVNFYVNVLGLRLVNRYGDGWATVEAGNGLTIGLHPASPKYPPPGTRGAMSLGFEIDEPIENAVARLREKGVRFTDETAQGDGGKFAHFEDPDGNPMYLWEMAAG